MFSLRRGFKYRDCPQCGKCMWQPRGRGEIVEQYGVLYARQYHHCLNCGIRMNLIRKLRSRTWSTTAHDAILT